MTAPARMAAARRRRTLPRVVHLVLVALLAPIVAIGAQTIAATAAVAVTAQAGTLAPVPLVAPRGFEAALATLLVEVEDANRQAAQLAQQEKDVVAEAERITKESAAIRDSKAALNARVAAMNQEISSHNEHAKAVDDEIAAHNARQHTFQMPAEAREAAAFNDEARQLEARRNQENAVEDKIQGEESQIRQEASQVDARSSQLDAASKANDSKASDLKTKKQQLQSRGQQLLAQMAQAIQSFASVPSNPAAAMDQGGDAPAPPPQTGNRLAGQDQDTGDSPYRRPRTAALTQYAKQHDTTVDTRPGTAYLTPDAVRRLSPAQAATLGSPAVTYDGLARKPNGHYTALRLQAPTAAAVPAPEVFASGGLVAYRNGEQLPIDGITTIQEAAASSESPPSADPQAGDERPDPEDCRRAGKGWVDYGKRDSANGNRATQMNACLDQDYLDTHEGSSVQQDPRPPGYNWARNYSRYLGNGDPRYWINNCHLLANRLSGSGTDLDNLATCSRAANAAPGTPKDPGMTPHMEDLEREVFNAITKEDQVVRYTVTPHYAGNRTVPYEFVITARGVYRDGTRGIDKESVLIENKIWSSKNSQWYNLGRVFDDRMKPVSPVPTGPTD
ncbi:DNA/RNA non-specific endonuclease [Kitasatospora sp. NPDC049258]|uniref:DNA/RNA non-specific endonuclease n=1 Tax=Kitasatospora sp. NPDC049258 TaxID=3155394 RepID=UPI00342A136D